VKVKYTDIMGLEIIKELREIVEDSFHCNSYSEGKIEAMETKLTKAGEMLGKLINTLFENKIITLDNVNTIIDHYTCSEIKEVKEAEKVKIQYLIGDATEPEGEGPKIIAHICNDEKKWGAGFVLALSEKWKKPEIVYLGNDLELGDVQFIHVDRAMWIANMVAQKGVKTKSNKVPIVYSALTEALDKVADFAIEEGASVHGPRFGAGLAGGDWNKIEYIINDTLIRKGVPVFIYTLEGA